MSGVDPLLQPKVWDNPELVRLITDDQSYRFFKRLPGTTLAAFTAGNPNSQIIFLDQGRTDSNFESYGFRILNEGGNWLEYSFDWDAPTSGVVHGAIAPNETLTDDGRRERFVYIRHVGGATNVRLWAW